MKNILIIGGRSPAALEMSRLLSNKHKIFVTDSFHFGICKYSKHVEKYYKIESPRFNTHLFLSSIIDIIKENKIDLVIPMNEEIFYVSILKSKLKEYTTVFCEDIDIIKKLHSKKTIHDMVKDIGEIKSPKTEFINNQEELNKINEKEINFIAKLEYSRFANDIYKNPKELNFQNLECKNKWLFQEYIEGIEYCTYTIAKEGKILGSSCYKPLYRINDSASVYFESVYHEKINEFIKAFVEKYQFTGQIGFDIIEKDNEIYLIECNPRGTSGIHLLENLDFDEEQENIKVTKNKMLTIPMFLYGKNNEKSKRNKKEDYKNANDAIFKKNDLLPLIIQPITLLEIFYKKYKYKTTLLESLTYDIEWNG